MKKRLTADQKTFNAVSYIVLIIFGILCILPFYLIIVASFTSESVIIQKGYSLLFRGFSIDSYKIALKNPHLVLQSYFYTILVTVIGTIIAVFISTMTGYVLQRQDFRWRNKFSFFFFFTTLFSGGLVPWYILCVRYLGFKNQIYALIIPGLFSVWNMIICKSYMKGVPFEITESAKIDGANDFMIFIRLMLPLATPLVATIGLFTALSYWNDWFSCMVFISKSDLFTLQYFLQKLLTGAEALRRIASKSGLNIPTIPIESLKMAMTVIVTGPIILLYPFLQRYFVKGLTIGAVKG